MRTLITNTFLLLFSLCHAQIRVVNTNLTKPDTNLLYAGWENVLEITSKGKKIKSITSDSLNIVNVGNSSYKVYAKGIMQSGQCSMKITYSDNKTQIYWFTLGSIPDPQAQLGDLVGTMISKEQFIQNAFVKVVMRKFYGPMVFTTVGFTLSIYNSSGTMVFSKIYTGERIDINDQQLLSRLQPGNKLEFTDITVNGPTRRKAQRLSKFFVLK